MVGNGRGYYLAFGDQLYLPEQAKGAQLSADVCGQDWCGDKVWGREAQSLAPQITHEKADGVLEKSPCNVHTLIQRCVGLFSSKSFARLSLLTSGPQRVKSRGLGRSTEPENE